MNKIMKIFHTRRSSKQLTSFDTHPASNAWSSPVPGPLAFPMAAWNGEKSYPF